MERAIQATAAARRIVIFTGAGMSADSGIGTFRGDGGAWSGFFGKLALVWGGTPIGWRWTPGLVWSRFVQDFVGPIEQAEAHKGHIALAKLLSLEKMNNNNDTTDKFESVFVITMNVDGLHQAAGFPQDHVAEVHGSVMRYRCISCERKLPDITLPLDPKSQPRCASCRGRARPDVTLFTESLPPDEWHTAKRAIQQLQHGDVLLVAGTSSVVYPAASLPSMAQQQQGATIIEFNRDFPTPLSDLAHVTVEGRAVETLPVFVQGVLDRKKNSQQQQQQQQQPNKLENKKTKKKDHTI